MLSFSRRGENGKILFSGEANFAVGCGLSGEKFNETGNKIFRLQPGGEKLNMLLTSSQSFSILMSNSVPSPDSVPDRAAFRRLQTQLAGQFEHAFPDPLALKTVVVVPSMTLDADILAKIRGYIHYEERMLCMLLLLRMPRTRIVFVSSMPICEEIIDYYLHLLPGITLMHARKRLVLLSCHDASNRPLTEKVLTRPRLMEQIRQNILPGHVAHLVGFNITAWEELLALQLGIPLYGCSSDLNFWGTKSGSRELFRQAGLLHPPGFENLGGMAEAGAALRELHRMHPQLRKAVVKLNDGFSGDGNAVFSFEQSTDFGEDSLRRHLKMVAADMQYDQFAEKMYSMGGVVEAFVEGELKTSPSVQCRINPLQKVEVISTHDQVLGGESGQVYTGATFPALPDYSAAIGRIGMELGEVMVPLGILGRFGIDFVSVLEGGVWKHYAIEINLRKGGTTHPYLMLQFLTGGQYDWENGVYRMPNGHTRCYFATDGLQSAAYRQITPTDLIDIAICHDIHFDATIQEGVTFHLLGALGGFGKLGLLCVGSTLDQAMAYYQKTVAVLDAETSGSA